MTDEQMEAAFNEWMRLYIEDPEAFEAELKTVKEFQAEERLGVKPTYGSDCTAIMHKMLARLS